MDKNYEQSNLANPLIQFLQEWKQYEELRRQERKKFIKALIILAVYCVVSFFIGYAIFWLTR